MTDSVVTPGGPRRGPATNGPSAGGTRYPDGPVRARMRCGGKCRTGEMLTIHPGPAECPFGVEDPGRVNGRRSSGTLRDEIGYRCATTCIGRLASRAGQV